MRPARLYASVALVAAGWAAFGCDGPEGPTGPPSCEPARELMIERGLKKGFRHLVRGEPEAAAEAFRAVLRDEASHPEAHDGLRQATRSGAVVRPGPVETSGGRILVAGSLVNVDVDVNTERYRFDEHAARARLLVKDMADAPPLGSWFDQRDRDGQRVDPSDRGAVTQAVDLIVLHDTRTLTVRESFVGLAKLQRSTHFMIEWDGTIFQTLDVAWEADHTRFAGIDERSVAIDLVNPVEMNAPGLPEGVDQHLRPLSKHLFIHDAEIQRWGYTDAQMASLEALVKALTKLLPNVPPRLPRVSGDTAVPRRTFAAAQTFSGILGHLHLNPKASDPGPGFDWEGFSEALKH